MDNLYIPKEFNFEPYQDPYKKMMKDTNDQQSLNNTMRWKKTNVTNADDTTPVLGAPIQKYDPKKSELVKDIMIDKTIKKDIEDKVGKKLPEQTKQKIKEKVKSTGNWNILGMIARAVGGLGDAMSDNVGRTAKYFNDREEYNRKRKQVDMMDDPKSDMSKKTQMILSRVMPGKKWDNISASQAERLFPQLFKAVGLDQERQKMQMMRQASGGEGGPGIEQKISKLTGENRKRLDNISMAQRGINQMSTALKNGDWTFKPFGDNDFEQARRGVVEAIARMQTGAAISSEEEERFLDMMPTKWDSKEMQQKKLSELMYEMNKRMASFGINPAEYSQWEQAATNSGGQQTANEVKRRDPKTGKTAIFNADTKEFIRWES